MATNDVPGANPANKDTLAMGCWAEHEDGSLILVESVEASVVVYSIFDVARVPPVEYRDAMPEIGFKDRFSYHPGSWTKMKADRWTWHDKTPFPWDRVMRTFPAGPKAPSAEEATTAAQRVAESLRLRAGAVREREEARPTLQRAATTIMKGIKEAIDALGR